MNSVENPVASWKRNLIAQGRPVVVEIYLPVVDPETGDDYSTRFIISGLPDGDIVDLAVNGVDEMQSISLALAMIGDTLESTGIDFSLHGASGHFFPVSQ